MSGATVTGPADVDLTIVDDDGPARAYLVVDKEVVSEDSSGKVWAVLDKTVSADVTVSVSATPVLPTTSSDYTVRDSQGGTSLTISAGDTDSRRSISPLLGAQLDITAVENGTFDPRQKPLTISGTALSLIHI